MNVTSVSNFAESHQDEALRVSGPEEHIKYHPGPENQNPQKYQTMRKFTNFMDSLPTTL